MTQNDHHEQAALRQPSVRQAVSTQDRAKPILQPEMPPSGVRRATGGKARARAELQRAYAKIIADAEARRAVS